MSNPFLQHAQRLKTDFLEREHLIFVDGKWIEPSGRERNAVIDPSTGEALTTIAMGKSEDMTARSPRPKGRFAVTGVEWSHLSVRASCSSSPI